MEVDRIVLTDFRNYERAETRFDPGPNLIVGGNGEGKTNLLEALYVASVGRSYRPGGAEALIRWGTERAVLNLASKVAGRLVRIDVELSASGARLLLGRASAERKDLSQALAVVLFSPDDLNLVQGGPEWRRDLLDGLASRMRPRALAVIKEFERTLRQRNGLLKAAQFNPKALKSLDAWDEQLVEKGAAVVDGRLGVLDLLGPAAAKHLSEITGGSDLQLSYRSSSGNGDGGVEGSLGAALKKARDRDLDQGFTSVGPHRDDLDLALGGSDARTYASQGEQRTVALALRLAERDLVARERGEEPVLLLDDVFSELDGERRRRLTDLVASGGQSIVTATSETEVPFSAGRRVRVAGGRVEELE